MKKTTTDKLNKFLIFNAQGKISGILILTLIIFLFQSCGTAEFKGFDQKAWISDPKACLGNRKELGKILLQNRHLIKGMDDDKILNLLGKPERTVHFERGRKNFYYFIEPGNQCGLQTKEGKKIMIEVNAIGYVSIIAEQDM